MARLLMARFDLYHNPGRNKAAIPYLLDVQSNVISGLATRLVIPLRKLEGFSAAALPPDLFPVIAMEGVECFLDTPQMGSIPVSELKHKAGSALEHQFAIQTALDRVFGAW
jgi:toxin CcdB